MPNSIIDRTSTPVRGFRFLTSVGISAKAARPVNGKGPLIARRFGSVAVIFLVSYEGTKFTKEKLLCLSFVVLCLHVSFFAFAPLPFA